MKITIGLFAFLGLVILGCSNAKEVALDKAPLLKVIDPYWIEIVPGQQDGEKSKVLFIPVAVSIQSQEVDSVYWRGYHRELRKSMMEGKEVYRVQIFDNEEKFMGQIPYPIEENQALVSYVNGAKEKRYFKVENIIQGESMFMP